MIFIHAPSNGIATGSPGTFYRDLNLIHQGSLLISVLTALSKQDASF